jgi:citrate synthase
VKTTSIGHSSAEGVVIRGLDLSTELLGKLDFVDMVLLTSIGRRPTPEEKVMLNLILVTACGHGITPSVLASRLTFLGAPEALQGALAAGLLGGGSVYLGPTQNIAQMLLDIAADLPPAPSEAVIASAARDRLAAMKRAGKPVLGIGSGYSGGDPRAAVMRDLARANGFYRLHWQIMDALAAALSEAKGKPFALNGAGALGAIIADMGLDPLFGRGLMLTGRCAGLLAHILEEKAQPIGQAVWDLVVSQEDHAAA